MHRLVVPHMYRTVQACLTCLKLAAAASGLLVSMPALMSSTLRCPALSPSTSTVAPVSMPAAHTTSSAPWAPASQNAEVQEIRPWGQGRVEMEGGTWPPGTTQVCLTANHAPQSAGGSISLLKYSLMDCPFACSVNPVVQLTVTGYSRSSRPACPT